MRLVPIFTRDELLAAYRLVVDDDEALQIADEFERRWKKDDAGYFLWPMTRPPGSGRDSDRAKVGIAIRNPNPPSRIRSVREWSAEERQGILTNIIVAAELVSLVSEETARRVMAERGLSRAEFLHQRLQQIKFWEDFGVDLSRYKIEDA